MVDIDDIQETVTIHKFGQSTLLRDLSRDAWEYLGLSPKYSRGKIGTLPHNLWRCSIGKTRCWYYGMTMNEAVQKALLSYT